MNKKENVVQDIILTLAVIAACYIMGMMYNEDLNFFKTYTSKDYFLYSCGLFVIIKFIYNFSLKLYRIWNAKKSNKQG